MNPEPAGLNQIEWLFQQLITIAVGAAFIIILVVLVWAGIKFITSGGDAESLQGAWQTVTWALLGILFLVLAWLILQLITVFTGITTLPNFDIRTLCGNIGVQVANGCPTAEPSPIR